jgi:hypothetical protein
MNQQDETKDREDKAIQALISAALHVGDEEVADQEIQKHLRPNVTLSAQNEAALQRAGRNPLATVPRLSASPEPQPAEVEAFMALHRKRPAGGFSARTEEEIKKKREELLAKLRQRKGGR